MSRKSVAQIRRRTDARIARIEAQINEKVMKAKSKERRSKSRSRAKSRSRNLPKIRTANLPSNYINPVRLSPVTGVVYQVTNRFTGRKNWYQKSVLNKLIGRTITNYDILMFNPKVPMFKNPVTRNPVFARNLQRVRVK